MRVLVTGGAGLVGSHLIDDLLADGHSVVAVDNFVTGRWRNIAHLKCHPAFRLIEADIVNQIVLPEDEPIDYVYHLASPASPVGYMSHPIATHLVNSIGTMNMLNLARKYGARFLFTSTSEIYGDPLVHPQREDYFGNVNPVGPRSCYDESKRFGESITAEYVRQFDLDARIVRLFNIYGPRNDPHDGRVIPAFISSALLGKPLPIFGDGSQTRSLCFVTDLVHGLRSTMECDAPAGSIFNLGNPDERTILELGQTINRLCGSSAGFEYLPARMDDPVRRCPDITKARTYLGWRPVTSLDAGLGTTIDYFRNHEGIGN